MAFDVEVRDEHGAVLYALWTGVERSYVLPDGRRCTVPQTVAWCRDCRAFVAAAQVPMTTAHLDDKLAALRAGPAGCARWAASAGEWASDYDLGDGWDRFRGMELEHLDLLVAWRWVRCSPARCLECFSTEIDPVADGAAEVVHPETGRRLRLATPSHTHLLARWHYITVEGLPFGAA